jgi:hypothetical protein
VIVAGFDIFNLAAAQHAAMVVKHRERQDDLSWMNKDKPVIRFFCSCHNFSDFLSERSDICIPLNPDLIKTSQP